MPSFAFYQPATVREACHLLADDPGGTKALAGGTAVVLMLQQGLIAPDALVSLAGLADLRGITREGGRLRIGAGTSLRDVAAAPDVRALTPSLGTACGQVGNPRVRNVATIGGNLAEADYASDPPAALASLGATCGVEGPTGYRQIPAADFVTGFYENALDDGELLVDVRVPIPEGRHAVYLKYRSRSSEDRPCVGVAACVDFYDGVVDRLDVVVGAVGPTPQRVPHVLAQARGHALDDVLATRIASDHADAIEPLDDGRGSSWYRRRMIAVFVRRALQFLATAQAHTGGAFRG